MLEKALVEGDEPIAAQALFCLGAFKLCDQHEYLGFCNDALWGCLYDPVETVGEVSGHRREVGGAIAKVGAAGQYQ